jgi:cobalt-zinc-cadmium efflux system membrane fusion protein
MNRWILILLFGFAAGCSREDPELAKVAAEAAAPVTAEKEVVLAPEVQREAGIMADAIQVRSLPQTLQATGRMTVNENRTWRVGAITEGRIIRVYANAGDAVKEGQILARMHSHDIHESRAEYRKAVAEVARLKAVESYAARVRDRAKRLYQLKAGSLQQVEQAETEYSNAQTALANAEVEAERAGKHLVDFLEIPAEEPKEHRSGLRESDEDLIPVKSPASGTLLTRNVTAGTVVTTTGDLFVVSDLTVPWMIAAVSEEHLAKLRVGMPVRVYVQAYGDRGFRGRIGKLGEELDPTTRTIMVRVDVPNPDGLLKPEMYATAEIELGQSEPSLFVPQVSVQEVHARSVVFVQKAKDRFEVRPVQLGRAVADTVEIAGGIRAGERIVTRGSYVLKSQLLKGSLTEE